MSVKPKFNTPDNPFGYPSSPVPKKKSKKLSDHILGKEFFSPAKVFKKASSSELSYNSPKKSTKKLKVSELQDTARFNSPVKTSISRSSKAVEDLKRRHCNNTFKYSAPAPKTNIFCHNSSNSFQLDHIKNLFGSQNALEPHKSVALRCNYSNSISRSLDLTKRNDSLKIIASRLKHSNTLTDICFYREKIWTCGLDYKVNCWNTENLSLKSSEMRHNKGIIGLVTYKDLMLTAARDGRVKYWSDYHSTYSIKAHKGGIKSIESTADYFITGSESIKLWSDASLMHEYSHPYNYSLTSLNLDSFVCGGVDKLNLFDKRARNSVSEFICTGVYFKCIKWDDFTFWTGSDVGLIVLFI
jgi:hypothetical protein